MSGGNLFVANFGTGTIGEYNTTTGATINASLVSGLNTPLGIAVSGGNLFVANLSTNTIGEYNATTGATINASLVSGLSGPQGIDVEAVPEPATLALITAGTFLCSIWRRRAG
jgi:DNA-binding beta-propeller fold protein YncE